MLGKEQLTMRHDRVLGKEQLTMGHDGVPGKEQLTNLSFGRLHRVSFKSVKGYEH